MTHRKFSRMMRKALVSLAGRHDRNNVKYRGRKWVINSFLCQNGTVRIPRSLRKYVDFSEQYTLSFSTQNTKVL